MRSLQQFGAVRVMPFAAVLALLVSAVVTSERACAQGRGDQGRDRGSPTERVDRTPRRDDAGGRGNDTVRERSTDRSDRTRERTSDSTVRNDRPVQDRVTDRSRQPERGATPPERLDRNNDRPSLGDRGRVDRTIDRSPTPDRTIDRSPTPDRTIDRSPTPDRTIDRGRVTDRTIDRGRVTDRTIDRGRVTDRTIDRSTDRSRGSDRADDRGGVPDRTIDRSVDRSRGGDRTNDQSANRGREPERGPTPPQRVTRDRDDAARGGQRGQEGRGSGLERGRGQSDGGRSDGSQGPLGTSRVRPDGTVIGPRPAPVRFRGDDGTVVSVTRRPSSENRGRDTARSLFTRSREGRRYEHGVSTRPAFHFTSVHLTTYFPDRYCYYPYYASTWSPWEVYCSPYYHYGICPPYFYRRHAHYYRPSVIFIEIPIYIGGMYGGYRDDDDYYLSRGGWYDDRWMDEPGLRTATYDLEDAFRYEDLDALARLTDRQTRLAIFQQGKYEYSLTADDYLDMTRDFLRTVNTTKFDVYKVVRRRGDTYSAYAKHVYRDRDGRNSAVYLVFVLEDIGGRWTLSQVDTSPSRLGR